MPRFFIAVPGKTDLQECKNSEEAQFVEIYWNWIASAVPMVLGLNDAVEKYQERFEKDGPSNSWKVIKPSTWFALFEYNRQYCSSQEAELLSTASLAIRP